MVASVFRGFTAAASLKRHDFANLGDLAAQVFRGFTAAASLKADGRLGNAAQVRGRFPRFHRRGLIEGRRHMSDRRSGSLVFRGFTAAASLKEGVVAVRADLDVRVFRGFTAAASLKV